LSKFSIFEAIYEIHQQKSVVQDKNNINNGKRPYIELLEIVRNIISKKHSQELADVIFQPEGEKLLKMLLTKYIYQNHLVCNEYNDINTLVEHFYADMAGFGFISELLADESIEEINANRWDDIEVITTTGWKKLEQHFLSPQQAIDITKKMCRLGGEIIDGSSPAKDSYITQGVRISALIPPVVDEEAGAAFSIRKQKRNVVTKEDLISWGTATEDELDFLNLCVAHGISIGIAGSTGSGKTTDINYLLRSIPYDKRIYSIEDSRELDLTVRDDKGRILNRVIHTKTRPSPNAELDVDSNSLLLRSLRFDPDIICPAEMRGKEALTAQESGRTGHTIITSLHASTALAAYTRIMTMCMMGDVNYSEDLLLKLIIEAYPIMVFKKQLPDKSRKFMNIIEAESYENGKIIYRTLFRYVITGSEFNEDGVRIKKMQGYHKRVDCISNRTANKLLENGANLNIIRKYAGKDWNPENDGSCTYV
jgi:pilus assembly protein CpaF